MQSEGHTPPGGKGAPSSGKPELGGEGGGGEEKKASDPEGRHLARERQAGKFSDLHQSLQRLLLVSAMFPAGTQECCDHAQMLHSHDPLQAWTQLFK